MKEIKKIAIRDFVKEYKSRVPQLQESYIKENLVIIPYVPFVRKDALAKKLVDISTYVYEDYTKEDGTVGRRKTDKIQVNSTAQYLFFCRLVIENYTNLTVETEGFFEEYDELKSSGLLDRLMVSTEVSDSLIPMNEITELRALIDMKTKDEIFNKTEVHNYVNSLVERFGNVLNVLAKPIINNINNMNEAMKDMNNVIEATVEDIERNDF